MNKKERKPYDVMKFLKADEFDVYRGYLQNLKHSKLNDFQQGITISLDSVYFEIRILNSDTVEIMFSETGGNELFTKDREFMFPYTVKVEALKERESLESDIKLGFYEQEFSAHYIGYSMIIKCRTLLEAVKAGKEKMKEVESYLDKAVRDFRPKLENFPDKLYTPEEYLQLMN
ncbi:MAG TPA: hypothetical protein VHO03_06730 [Ignavibacteriales bacterium]|nr:hypothetical protein [Ignavibacteriales bacterium]